MKSAIILVLALCSFSVANALELAASALSPEKASARESKFSPQVPVAEEQKQFDAYTAKGLLPIYSERKDGKVRAIYISKPEGCSFWTFAGMDDETLLKRQEKHRKEGFVLISCVAAETELGREYWATWVSRDSENTTMKEMRRLGISQASIKK